MSVLKRHFNLNRKQLDLIVNESLSKSNNISFDLSALELESFSSIKNYTFFVSREKETKLYNLWNHKKLVNTLIYASFVDALNNFGTDLIFCYIAGDPVCMRVADLYDGSGGIFCKASPQASSGVVIEPFKTYLELEFPANTEE